jgi:hypothetical protein
MVRDARSDAVPESHHAASPRVPGESQRRTAILEGGHLARVHVFRKRLPMMHRHGWAGPKASSAIPYAWFVWDQAHRGDPTLHRI